MSFKDLERGIQARLEAERAEAQRIADRKAYKAARTALNKRKAARPPLFRPDPPPVYRKVVVLSVRRVADGNWGDLLTIEYTADTVSDSAAELEAKARASADGYVWKKTVAIRQGG